MPVYDFTAFGTYCPLLRATIFVAVVRKLGAWKGFWDQGWEISKEFLPDSLPERIEPFTESLYPGP
jgi:hypothetical protein